MPNQKKYLPIIMLLLPLLFFAYQFVLRLWPGLMMQQIMTQFAIDASGFGLISAVYYYGYAGMQIPVAILLDKFGARRIVFIFALVCGLALLLFTYTHNFYLALLSRFLIGAGSAVGLLGVSKVVSEWFSNEQYSKLIGISVSFGLLGAVYGGKPLTHLIGAYDWQNIAVTLAVISIAIGCLTFIILRSPNHIKETETNSFNKEGFTCILSSKVIWLLALANLLMVGALEGFADAWGVPYLVGAYGFAKSESASLISFIFIGMICGGPVLALMSKKWGNYSVIAACGLGLAFMFGILLSNTVHNWWALMVVFFIIGMMCCYQVIIFAAGASFVSVKNLGITIAFLNCINMLGGSFFHTLIGALMDQFWTGTLDSNGVRIYSIAAYQYSLALIPICAALGAFIVYYLSRKPKEVESKFEFSAESL